MNLFIKGKKLKKGKKWQKMILDHVFPLLTWKNIIEVQKESHDRDKNIIKDQNFEKGNNLAEGEKVDTTYENNRSFKENVNDKANIVEPCSSIGAGEVNDKYLQNLENVMEFRKIHGMIDYIMIKRDEAIKNENVPDEKPIGKISKNQTEDICDENYFEKKNIKENGVSYDKKESY